MKMFKHVSQNVSELEEKSYLDYNNQGPNKSHAISNIPSAIPTPRTVNKAKPNFSEDNSLHSEIRSIAERASPLVRNKN